jgi:hypothetical protein
MLPLISEVGFSRNVIIGKKDTFIRIIACYPNVKESEESEEE